MRALNLTDRLGLCEGICCILAALPDDDKQLTAFESMTSRVLFMLEDSVGKARDSESDSTISYLADSIKLLAALPRTFADACSSNTDLMESGCDTSPDKHAEIPESLIKIFQRGWPSLELASENYSHFEVSFDWKLTSRYGQHGNLTAIVERCLFALLHGLGHASTSSNHGEQRKLSE